MNQLNFLCMSNGQSAVTQLSNNQLQVLLTGKFGDGCLLKNPHNLNYHYSTCSIHKEYIEFFTAFQNKMVAV